MDNWEKTEFYILLPTIIIGAVVSILDFIGVLDTTPLNDRIPAITLLLVALIACSLLFNLQNNRQFLKSVLPTGTIKKFESIEETKYYIYKKMNKANKRIYDTTLHQNKTTIFYGKDEYEHYLQIIEEVSKRILYRELVFFTNNSNTWKARRLVEKAGKFYQLSCYINQPEDEPIRWCFIIVDDEIIFIEGIAIKQPEVVEYFKTYYDTLWQSAIPIKSGGRVNTEVLDQIDKRNKENEK